MGVLLCPCTHKVHQRRAWEASHLRDTLIQQSFSVNQNNHASHTQTDNTVTMDTVNYQRERERTSRVQLFCSALDCKHGFWVSEVMWGGFSDNIHATHTFLVICQKGKKRSLYLRCQNTSVSVEQVIQLRPPHLKLTGLSPTNLVSHQASDVHKQHKVSYITMCKERRGTFLKYFRDKDFVIQSQSFSSWKMWWKFSTNFMQLKKTFGLCDAAAHCNKTHVPDRY